MLCVLWFQETKFEQKRQIQFVSFRHVFCLYIRIHATKDFRAFFKKYGMSNFSYSGALMLQEHQAISVQGLSTILGTWSPSPSKLYNPQENLSEPYIPVMQSAVLVSSLALLHTKTRSAQ